MSEESGFGAFSVNTSHLEPNASWMAIRQKLDWLQKSKFTHNDVLGVFLSDEAGRDHAMGPVLVSITNRSFGLINGFSVMVKRRNAVCAYPLLRLQLDNALRLHAFELVDDQLEFVLAVLDGGQINHMNSRDGRKLTDKFLHTSLAARFPWVSRAYEEACGFVHYSKTHINASLDPYFSNGNDKVMTVRDEGPVWPDPYVIEAIDSFIEATKCAIELTQDWIARK